LHIKCEHLSSLKHPRDYIEVNELWCGVVHDHDDDDDNNNNNNNNNTNTNKGKIV
jgi:hypothetical protein